MKRPDFSSVKLSELFSLKDTPATFQASIWRTSCGAASVLCGISMALTAMVATQQDNGGAFDLHKDAQTLVDRKMETSPEMNREKLHTEMMQRADTVESRRMAALIALMVFSGAGAGISYQKLKAVKNSLTP